jgi:P-type E1-E2 ATPase
LETQSRHPLALALQRDLFVGSQKNLFLEDWKEKISEGVFARYQGSEWSITTDHQAQVDQGSVSLSLKKNGKQVARLKLRDRIRSDSHWATRKLKDWGLKLAILSGDRRENVVAVAKELRIPFAQGQMSPEAKAQVLADYPNSLMIGDGANDGIALKRAHVGIAVHNSVEISLGAADIYVSKPGLSSILDLLLIAREAHRLIMRNLFISAFYNIIGITLAITGLMVFASSYLSTSKLRHLNKDISANKRAAPLAEGIA